MVVKRIAGVLARPMYSPACGCGFKLELSSGDLGRVSGGAVPGRN